MAVSSKPMVLGLRKQQSKCRTVLLARRQYVFGPAQSSRYVGEANRAYHGEQSVTNLLRRSARFERTARVTMNGAFGASRRGCGELHEMHRFFRKRSR